MRSSVDLPEPLRPTRQMRSSAPTANTAPDSNAFVPKVTLIFCSRSNGGGMSGCPDRQELIAAMHNMNSHLPPTRTADPNCPRPRNRDRLLRKLAFRGNLHN